MPDTWIRVQKLLPGEDQEVATWTRSEITTWTRSGSWYLDKILRLLPGQDLKPAILEQDSKVATWKRSGSYYVDKILDKIRRLLPRHETEVATWTRSGLLQESPEGGGGGGGGHSCCCCRGFCCVPQHTLSQDILIS